MKKQDIAHLETRVNELCQGLAGVADDTDFKEFLKIIHRPGWTTIAEAALVLALVDAMQAQTKTLSSLKVALLKAGSLVELNPQPLPP